MAKSAIETATQLLDTPEVHAKLWKVITDAEASDDPAIVKRAKRLRQQREALDRQHGRTPPSE